MRVRSYHGNSLSLKNNDPNRKLYLTITEGAYDRIFCMLEVATQVVNHSIRLIVFNPNTRKIISWKK